MFDCAYSSTPLKVTITAGYAPNGNSIGIKTNSAFTGITKGTVMDITTGDASNTYGIQSGTVCVVNESSADIKVGNANGGEAVGIDTNDYVHVLANWMGVRDANYQSFYLDNNSILDIDVGTSDQDLSIGLRSTNTEKQFKGWSLESDATDVITSNTFTSNETVYAIWEDVSTATVSSIAIKTPSSHKIAYKVGDALDVIDLVITATKSDNSEADVNVTSDTRTGNKLSG